VISTNGCRHDHHHGTDPNLGNDVFGPPGAWYEGGSISGLFQTTLENESKHEAYNYMVVLDIPQPDVANIWICDFRIQSHVTAAPFKINDVLSGGYLSQFHSAVVEVQVCDMTGGELVSGVNRTAGWYDFGCLFFENDTPVDPDPSSCDFFGPRRIHFNSNGGADCCAHFFWYGKNHPTAANPVQIAIASFDAAVDLHPDTPRELDFICLENQPYNCRFNDSTRQPHLVVLFPTPGMRTGEFWADRYGVEVEGCTAVGLDCIPNLIEYPVPFELQFRTDGEVAFEYDDCAPDWCISYPQQPSSNPPPTLPPPTATPVGPL
jgi:hypothetical protein